MSHEFQLHYLPPMELRIIRQIMDLRGLLFISHSNGALFLEGLKRAHVPIKKRKKEAKKKSLSNDFQFKTTLHLVNAPNM
jgi:hypothetical protein